MRLLYIQKRNIDAILHDTERINQKLTFYNSRYVIFCIDVINIDLIYFFSFLSNEQRLNNALRRLSAVRNGVTISKGILRAINTA